MGKLFGMIFGITLASLTLIAAWGGFLYWYTQVRWIELPATVIGHSIENQTSRFSQLSRFFDLELAIQASADADFVASEAYVVYDDGSAEQMSLPSWDRFSRPWQLIGGRENRVHWNGLSAPQAQPIRGSGETPRQALERLKREGETPQLLVDRFERCDELLLVDPRRRIRITVDLEAYVEKLREEYSCHPDCELPTRPGLLD